MIVVFFIIHVKGICLAPWGFGGWRRGLVLVVFGVKSVWHRYYFEDKGRMNLLQALVMEPDKH
jgi:hypothetical protein